MPTLKDEAICIGQRKYSETSQIVTLFGREYGKLRAIAKGSRREKAKFSGGVDLLNNGYIQFVSPREGQSLGTLTEFDLVESWPQLRGHLISLHCGQFIAAMVDDFTEELDPHPHLYDILKVTLERLKETAQPEVVLVGFELALFREVGLSPIWHRCCACGKSLPEKVRVYFSSENGGILCRECEGAVFEKWPVNARVLDLLNRPENLSAVGREVVISLHELLCYHYREVQGKQSKIMIFLNHLLKQGGRSHG